MPAHPRSPPQLLRRRPPRPSLGGHIFATPPSRPRGQVARSSFLPAPPFGLAPSRSAWAQVPPEARRWRTFRRRPLGQRRRRPSSGEREAPWSFARPSHKRPLRARLRTRAHAPSRSHLQALRAQGARNKRPSRPGPSPSRPAGAQPAYCCARAPALPPAPETPSLPRRRPGHARQTAPLPSAPPPSTRPSPSTASTRPPASPPPCQLPLTHTSVRLARKQLGSHQRRRPRSATRALLSSFQPRSSHQILRKPTHSMSPGRLRSPLLLHQSPTSPSFW